MTSDLTFGSLFSGIGGLDLGLERAGWECRWQVEIDPFCQQVLAKHWPGGVIRYGDIREVDFEHVEPVDLICGGFPCQPHSLAGKRRGAADDRNLWPQMFRAIDQLRPAWALAENVPGIVTTILDDVLFDLESAGYATGTLIIPACAFDAPHRRDRVFIVAHLEGGRREGIGLPIRQGRSYETALDTHGSGAAMANSDSTGLEIGQEAGQRSSLCSIERPTRWIAEPNVVRVADGIPGRVDRLRALGNAVVPQVAEWIGHCILEAQNEMERTHPRTIR